MGTIAGLVVRDGTQYEPDVYQPRGQVPTLTTGLWRPTTVESTSANMVRLDADVEVLSQVKG